MRAKITAVLASITLMGCTVYGQVGRMTLSAPKGFYYTLNTPEGWKVDKEKTGTEKVRAVFVPKEESTTSIITNVSPLEPKYNESIVDVIDFDINMYKLTTPGATITEDEPVVLSETGAAAKVVKVAADANGYQAIAYINEVGNVPVVILSAESKAEFDRNYPTFRKLVASYKHQDKVVMMGSAY